MAEGRSNAGIARRLWVTEGTVEKHVRSILGKLSLPETERTIVTCWPSLPSSTPNDPVRAVTSAGCQQVADGTDRQGDLGQETDGRLSAIRSA